MPAPDRTTPHGHPQVTVLLATYNGARWLDEQLDSILGQVGVDVSVIALDDESTDRTPALLADRAAVDPRVTVLPGQGSSGSAAANFYRLLCTVPLERAGLVAFADQDDVWMPDKLARHAAILQSGGVDGVSSDVTAFSEDGRRSLVRKSYPQREFDYLLESPGPGCSFLLSNRLARLSADVLEQQPLARTVDFHDWLIYVLCRAHGWGWHIDDVPSLDYRQHDSNAMGANVGAQSAQSRLQLIRQRWHRRQSALLAGIALSIAPERSRRGLEQMRDLIAVGDLRSRLALARRAGQLRRRPRDRAIIGILIALGIW